MTRPGVDTFSVVSKLKSNWYEIGAVFGILSFCYMSVNDIELESLFRLHYVKLVPS